MTDRSNQFYLQSLALHFLLWILIPFVFFSSLSIDTIESVVWGKEWQLGYLKHPPLTAWLTYMSTKIFDSLHGSYVFSQIQVLMYLWGIFKLVTVVYDKDHAQASIIFALASFMSNVFVTKTNPETLQWALTPIFCWSFFMVLNKGTHYKTLGFLAGLLVLSKYSCVGLFMAAAVLFIKKKGIKDWGLAKAIIAFFLTISPHIYWLIQNDFLPFRYMQGRINNSFDLKQLVYFIIIPFMMHFFPAILTILYKGKVRFIHKDLAFLFLGPWVGMILFTLLTKSGIRGHWVYPLSALMPALLISCFKEIPKQIFYLGRNVIVFIAISVGTFHSLLFLGYFSKISTSRCFLNPKDIKNKIEKSIKSNISPKMIIGPDIIKWHLEYLYGDFNKHGTLIICDSLSEFEIFMKRYDRAKRYPSIHASKNQKKPVEFFIGFEQ